MSDNSNGAIVTQAELNDTGRPDTADDFVAAALFRRHSKTAPKITLSEAFSERSLPDQIKYLHKLASTYHEAAMDLNAKNTEANQLLFAKESQLSKALAALGTDRAMIQKQLMRENEERQKLLGENTGLHAEIKELQAQLKYAGVQYGLLQERMKD